MSEPGKKFGYPRNTNIHISKVVYRWFFFGNWSGYATPLRRHFACTLESGDVGYYGALAGVREGVPLAWEAGGEGRILADPGKQRWTCEYLQLSCLQYTKQMQESKLCVTLVTYFCKYSELFGYRFIDLMFAIPLIIFIMVHTSDTLIRNRLPR